ncbi:MAG TPA: hypothetical protein DEP56_01995 [Pseudomonas sp.]|nr:hypothetical protein [Pseudomonas sp.]|tara:strand:+ start:137 stop:406 length:270 start_codon:yes stop_codon:yes gene_type:complete
MADQHDRLLMLEGQMAGMAKAWLYLAAQIEIQRQLEPEKMQSALLNARWPDQPFEPHAQQLMSYLAGQLAEARESRRAQELYQTTGRDE